MQTMRASACVFAVLAVLGTDTYAQTAKSHSFITHSQPVPSDPDGAGTPVAFSPALIGTWTSAPDATKLTSDFDKSVWGVNATAVRTLALTVRPTGEGTLRLTKKVIDAKGRVAPASTWIEETQLTVGRSTPGVATRIEHDAQVVKAVRLFPDDPEYRWPIDGLRVRLVTVADGDGNSIEIRYDTPEGRGSFWETLRRQGSTTSRSAAR
jgi:hypothetical protein